MVRVLLFNAKREKCNSTSPHLGLAMLAARLKENGHEPLVIDYQLKHYAPPPDVFIREFKPNVIGITLYTATMKEAERIIDSVASFNIPIIVGGPHATLYYDELSMDNRINNIVRGEAENIINQIVESDKFHSKSRVIMAELPDPKDLPSPDFTCFVGYKDITVYPLSTSRGCPNNCSFCVVHMVSSTKWRPRKPDACVMELIEAKKMLSNLISVSVYDDNPMVKTEHIKEFLNLYIDKNIDMPLTIVNTRADRLDKELILLLKKAKCTSIALGVESGCPEVFQQIGKGETLEDIKRAAKLIKKHNISLCLCFVIGLPGDTFEKTKWSIKLASELKADHVYWNMIAPYRGTRVRDWYEQHGKVFDVINYSSWIDGDFLCDEPCAESAEFSTEERKKAYFMAIMETNDIRLRLTNILRLIPYAMRYKLYGQFFYWLLNCTKRDFHKALRIYGEKGAREAIKGMYHYIKGHSYI